MKSSPAGAVPGLPGRLAQEGAAADIKSSGASGRGVDAPSHAPLPARPPRVIGYRSVYRCAALAAWLMVAASCSRTSTAYAPGEAAPPSLPTDALACNLDSDCVALPPPFCGCPPCGHVRLQARRKDVPANCEIVGGQLLCAACDQDRRGACPRCKVEYEADVAVCLQGRCALSRDAQGPDRR
jgi:hypothetical protein